MPPSQTEEDVPIPRSASIIPSSSPLADAVALMRLFPGRFTLEEEEEEEEKVGDGGGALLPSSSRSASLVGTTAGSDCHPSVIVLVDFQQRRRTAAVGTGRTIAPNATLIADGADIAAAVASLQKDGGGSDGRRNGNGNGNGGGGGGELSAAATTTLLVASAPSPALWAVMQLGGGGVVVVASGSAFSSPERRLNFARAVSRQESNKKMVGEYSEEEEEEEGEDQSLADVDLGDSSLPRPRELSAQGVPSASAPPPPPYAFPSLSLSILSDGKVTPGFPANTRVGIPVESDLFVGTVLLILRPPTPTDDMYYYEKVFATKRRRFEIQIQGRFKYVPTGTVYCGFEVTNEMKLGLVAKGMCNFLLKLVSKTVSASMSFSFGDAENEELPHISFPAFSLFDKLVVTKPGEVPPPLGETLPESEASAAARKKSADAGDWNAQDVYSMSYHSMYLDLPIWHVVNLPMRDLDLQTFWGDSSLRIVVYENNRGNEGEGKHLQRDNKYLAGIQADFVGFGDDVDIRNKIEEQDALPWDKTVPAMPRSISYLNLANDDNIGATPPQPAYEYLAENDVESDDETAFFDAEVSLMDSGTNLGPPAEDNGDTIAMPKIRSVNMSLPDMLCPGWIEMCSGGKYTKVYAFTVANDAVQFRTAPEFGHLFSVQEGKAFVERKYSARLSSSEKLRRIMGHTLAGASQNGDPSSRSYQCCLALQKQSKGNFDESFLRRPSPPDSAAKVKNKNVSLTGYVGRALSERHWIEEWAIITEKYITFFHPDGRKPSFRISLQGISAVKKLDASECPYFPSYHFLSIETLTRVVYLMYRTEEECMRWQMALSSMPQVMNLTAKAAPSPMAKSGSSKGSASEYLGLMTFDDPTEEYLHKSSLWSCKQRRLLNCRKLDFSSLGKMKCEAEESIHPLTAVQSALQKALEPMGDSEDKNLQAFLDSAAELKAVNVMDLTEAERTAFFINLYHVQVMHAFLVLGTPNSSFKWVSYFSMIAYECSDDIFSLTELEHNIIRARMTSPSQFVAKFVLPKSVYKFSLQTTDFRINFAINCGSLSNPRTVQSFGAKELDAQLDDAARDYLKVTTVVSGRRGVYVTLPKICQWYAGDFGRGRQTDILLSVKKFLDDKHQDLLPTSVYEINVRFLPYDFSCRQLQLRPCELPCPPRLTKKS